MCAIAICTGMSDVVDSRAKHEEGTMCDRSSPEDGKKDSSRRAGQRRRLSLDYPIVRVLYVRLDMLIRWNRH